MKRFKARSLRQSLMLWLLALLLPLWLGVGVHTYYRAYDFANVAFNRSLLRAALALADQVRVVNRHVVVDLPQKSLDLMGYDQEDWIYFRVQNPKGQTVVGDDELALPKRLPASGGHAYYETHLNGETVSAVVFALPLTGTQVKGVALVQVAETQAKRRRVVGEILTEMMWPQTLLVVLVIVLVSLGISRGLRPLKVLLEAIRSRSHQDLSPITVQYAPFEVESLQNGMNDLLQRIRHMLEQQKRFVLDASHQLRTPLAGLQTHAEIALQETEPQVVRREVQWIQLSVLRLSHLVNRLLALAMADPDGMREYAFSVLDANELVRTITQEWVPMALRKGIDLGFEPVSHIVYIRGDAAMLQEALANLIDNAIRYTQAPGIVTVSVAQEGDTVIVRVEDNGVGIPMDERTRVFDRFYRPVESQSEGCGLGLAIVQEVVLSHQGRIQVAESRYGKGTCMAIYLPRAR